jgi:hypothetical protein
LSYWLAARNLSHLKLEFSRKLFERAEAMKKNRFSEEPIIGILTQGETWTEDGGAVPWALDQCGDLLRLGAEVQQDGGAEAQR